MVSQRLGDGVALDQLGDFGADHVRAQQLAGLGVEHGLDQALGLAQRDRLAVADEGEAADLDLVARRPCALASVRPTLATCGHAIGAAGHVADVRADARRSARRCARRTMHALVHRLVREPGRADQIADGIDARLAGLAPFVDDDMGLLDLDLGAFEADILDIADDADRRGSRARR